ncbi:MAG: ATP-binding cassette domain-containing protein [Lachnospiraceae bacterium]|nr:ATP-binding cassette domain-containing protein [Lachnospiraceae bacterium]
MLKININNVLYFSATKPIIDRFNLTLHKNMPTVIIGNNGSGKTTIFSVIGGIIPEVISGSWEGEVLYNDEPILHEHLDYVFQNGENSLFYYTGRMMFTDENIKKYDSYLRRGHIYDKLLIPLVELSQGQRKLLCCLQAMFSNRPICLMDEPTTHLDSNAITVLEEVISVVSPKKIIVFVTHNLSFADRNAKRWIRINDGKAEEIVKPLCKSKPPLKVSRGNNGRVLISFENLNIAFKNKRVITYPENITIFEDEVLMCLGSNGAGKTTLLNYIIENRKRLVLPLSHRKLRISAMFQDLRKQFFTSTVVEELKFSNRNLSLSDIVQTLEQFRLCNLQDENPNFLSDGQKRTLLLICMLLSEPDLLLLDEPFENIDATARCGLCEIIKKRKRGTIIIFDQTYEEIEKANILDRIIYLR